MMENNNITITYKKKTLTYLKSPVNIKFKKENPYKITNEITRYRGGFPVSEIPGTNRKEQLDFLIKILNLNPDGNNIGHVFYNDNSWMAVHFNNKKELYKCVEEINSKHKIQ